MRASLASRATGGRLRNRRPIVPGPFRPRLARWAPSTRPAPPCTSLVRLRSGLRLLSRLLTPLRQTQPRLADRLRLARRAKQRERTCGRAGALQPCPAHPDAPGTGTLCLLTPRHSHAHLRVQVLAQLDTCSCRVARRGGPLLGEDNRRLDNSKRRATTSPLLDVRFWAPKPCYGSRLKQHRCYAHQTGTQAFVPETTNRPTR